MKKYHILLTLFMLFFFIFSSCQTSQVDIQAEIDTVRSLEDTWTSGLQTKNVDQIIDLHSTDFILMRPNGPAIVGLQADRDRMESNFKDTTLLYDTYTSTLDAVEIAASGDLAYTRGHDIISIKTKTGIVQEHGKYVDVWKKIDGEWKTIISIFNSDEPLVEE